VPEKIYVRDKRSPIPKNKNVSRVMSANKDKNSKPEILLRKALSETGIRGYRLHYKKIAGKPDVAFVSKKIAIFVNGCFWHCCPYCKLQLPRSNQEFWMNKFKANKQRDKRKLKELRETGWIGITIWECQIYKHMDKMVEKLKKKLR
jgi:DNA mismatch endonuclease, patch repair protein